MKRLVCCSALLAGLSVGAVETPAKAKVHSRTGFYGGFGFGAGRATWEWAQPDLSRAEEVSGTFHLRAGRAIRDNLLVGFEGSVWAKRWDIVDVAGTDLGELTLRLAAMTAAVTFYPGNVGVALRAGVGVAGAFPDDGNTAPGFSPDTETGLALLGAVGYDWRLTQRFAIGPELHASFLFISGDTFDNPIVLDGGIQLNWYW